MKIVLEVKNTKDHTTQQLSFSRSPLLFGRSRICDVALADPILSRQHCSLEIREKGRLQLTDLESANGTFFNGQKINVQLMNEGEAFKVGDFEVRVRELDLAEEEEPTLEQIYPVTKTSDTKAQQSLVAAAKTVAAAAQREPSVVSKVSTQTGKMIPAQGNVGGEVDLTLKTPVALKKRGPVELYKTKDWVQVSLLWKGELVDIRCFDRGEIVTIGSSPGNDFLVVVPQLPAHYKLLKILPTGLEIQLHPAMAGVIETRKEVRNLDELRLVARQSTLGITAFVEFDDRCLIEIGPFALFIQSARLNLTAPLTAPLVKEPLFAGILTIVFAAITFATFLIHQVPQPPEEEKKLEPVVKLENPEVVPPKPPPPPPPPPPPKKKEEVKKGPVAQQAVKQGGDQGAGAKAKGDVGKAGRTTGKINIRARPIGIVSNVPNLLRSAPKGALGKNKDPNQAAKGLRPDQGVGSGKPKPKGSGTQAPSLDVKPKVNVEDMGISGALNGRGGGGKASAGEAMEGRGLGGELEGSLEGLERGADIDSKGSGGRGAKGLGLGGGGSSLEVGGLATKGKGGGSKGFGLGSSGSKGDAEVSYNAEEVQVEDGLTREEIERVVRAHQREIQACYEKALIAANGKAIGGRLKVGWFVNKEGRVDSVNEVSGIGDSGTLFGCVSGSIKTWQFPKPRGGSGVQVSWPWVFRKGG